MFEKFLNFNKPEKNKDLESLENAKENLNSLYRFGKRMLMPTFIATTMLVGTKLGQEKYTGFQSTDIEDRDKVENTEGIKTNLPEISIYGHSDPVTDAMLNFLTGKQDFSSEEKVKYFRMWEESVLEIESIQSVEAMDLYKKIKKMSDQEFIDYMKRGKYGFDPSESELLLLQDFDVARYSAIWELHRRNGNPKIDFVAGQQDFQASNGTPLGTHYLSGENKIMLNLMHISMSEGNGDTSALLNDWIAELSHSKQSKEKPFTARLRFLLDLMQVQAYKVFSDEDFATLYNNKLYLSPGSHEYEAHTILQPQLEESLEKRIKEINNELEKISK